MPCVFANVKMLNSDKTAASKRLYKPLRLRDSVLQPVQIFMLG